MVFPRTQILCRPEHSLKPQSVSSPKRVVNRRRTSQRLVFSERGQQSPNDLHTLAYPSPTKVTTNQFRFNPTLAFPLTSARTSNQSKEIKCVFGYGLGFGPFRLNKMARLVNSPTIHLIPFSCSVNGRWAGSPTRFRSSSASCLSARSTRTSSPGVGTCTRRRGKVTCRRASAASTR